MTLLNYIYDWVSSQLVGVSNMVELARYESVLIGLFTVIGYVAVIYILFWLVGWVIRFVSSQFPW